MCKRQGYAMNNCIVSSSECTGPFKYSKIDQLSEVLLIIDIGQCDSPLTTNKYRSYVGPTDGMGWKGGAGGPSAEADWGRYHAGFPHGNMSNVLFCDFHVG